MKAKHVKDPNAAKRLGYTCEKGECIEKIQKNGKTIEKTCDFKPSITDVSEGTHDPDCCPYYLQKYTALNSPHSLWNYHSYFQIMRYNKKLFAEYLDRKVSVFDEAHKIEDQIIQFVGIDITAGQLDECNIDPKSHDFADIDSMATLLDEMSDVYARRIREVKESRSFQENPDFNLLSRLERRYDRISHARIDILDDKDNFVANNPEKDIDGSFRMVSIKPIDISRFAGAFFETENQVFMSATIDRDSFCENMGIKPSEVAFVDTPVSPFQIQNRRIEFLNVKRLNYSSSQLDEMEVIGKIDEIMSRHSEERGLILTSSIPRCHHIRKNLTPSNRKRVRICHSTNPDGRSQDDVLKEHAGDPSGVLLSSSLWEGVDLKDDLSRFQIIAKVPYPNYTEKRTRIKKERFPLWYTSQTLMKLLQGFGRSVRSEHDYAVTYVLDSAINYLLIKGKKMIPHAYYDVLGLR